jgi:RHS repeat-associated protein
VKATVTVSNWVSGAWQAGVSERYIYDNWNLFAIFPASSPTWKMSYTWGPDLSGSMQGAGGVGGLLGMRDGNSGTNYFCAYDGNGNVAGFVNANNGLLSAQYEYDPFGNVLRATGYLSQTNTVRFSSKMQDLESGWSYYGYRYYNPNYGEWVSRDPIAEKGGVNLYSITRNNCVNFVDIMGLLDWIIPPSSMGAAYAKTYCEMKQSGGLASWFPQNAFEPAAGNQTQGYPENTDFSGWFLRNQPRQINLQMQNAREAIKAAIQRRCNENLSSFELNGPQTMPPITITPDQQVDLRVSRGHQIQGREIPGDVPQTWWQARRGLGRFNFRLSNVSANQVFCTCNRCYVWSASLEATDTPGITSTDDGFFGKIMTGWGFPTDLPEFPIARWKMSGVVCCPSKL